MEKNNKYYSVVVKNVARFQNLELPEFYKVYAVERENELREIVTDKKILVDDTRVLEPVYFLSQDASLFAIRKEEMAKDDFLSIVEQLKNTNINDYLKTINALSELTVRIAKLRANNIKENSSRKTR